MSALQGFDFVLELSPNTLLSLVQTQLAASNFEVPFEESIAIPAASGGGNGHFVFRSIQLFVISSGIQLSLQFHRSSIIGNHVLSGPGNAELSNLSGQINIDLNVSMIQDRTVSTLRNLFIDFPNATVRCALDIPNSLLTLALGAAFQAYIRSQVPAQTVHIPFSIDPSRPPSVSPLNARELRLGFFAPTAASQQSLAIFANFIHTGVGNPSGRSTRAIPPDRDFLVALSPAAFHQLLFVPAVMGILDAPIPQDLPPTCGGGTLVPYRSLPDWKVSRIADTFRPGFIEIDIDAQNNTPGDWGRTIKISLIGHLSFSIEENAVRPAWTTESIGTEVDFAWAWWFTSIFAPGLHADMGLTAILVQVLSSSAGSHIAPDLSSATFGLQIPGATLTSVTVDVEQLAINGTVPSIPIIGDTPSISIGVDLVTESQTIVDQGNYQSTGCPIGEYPFTRVAQQQRASFRVTSHFMSYPIRATWSVCGFEAPHAVPATGGPARLSADCTFGSPPGQRAINTDVEITCELSADAQSSTLTVLNTPANGGYQLNVQCLVTDASGLTAWNAARVIIEGDLVTFGGTWQQDLEACVANADARLHQYIDMQNLNARIHQEGGDPSLSRFARAAFSAAMQGPNGLAMIRNIVRTLGPTALSQFSAGAGSGASTHLVSAKLPFSSLAQSAVANPAAAAKVVETKPVDVVATIKPLG
jgi:hypothetical protein